MKKFEYKTTFIAKIAGTEGNWNPHTLFENESLIIEMNKLGSEGWELIQIVNKERNRTSTEGTYGGSWGATNLKVPVSETILDGYNFIWKREL